MLGEFVLLFQSQCWINWGYGKSQVYKHLNTVLSCVARDSVSRPLMCLTDNIWSHVKYLKYENPLMINIMLELELILKKHFEKETLCFYCGMTVILLSKGWWVSGYKRLNH
jgi:hypothetical protein